MRYKYLTIILMFSALFAQDKISLENVLDGTFRTESIGNMIGRIVLIHIIFRKEVMKG